MEQNKQETAKKGNREESPCFYFCFALGSAAIILYLIEYKTSENQPNSLMYLLLQVNTRAVSKGNHYRSCKCQRQMHTRCVWG